MAKIISVIADINPNFNKISFYNWSKNNHNRFAMPKLFHANIP